MTAEEKIDSVASALYDVWLKGAYAYDAEDALVEFGWQDDADHWRGEAKRILEAAGFLPTVA